MTSNHAWAGDGKGTEAVEGFSNYATAGVAMTLDNDREMHEHTRGAVRHLIYKAAEHENIPNIWTVEEAERFTVADWLKAYAETRAEYGNPSLLGAQMIQAGLSAVNWHELADYYIAIYRED